MSMRERACLLALSAFLAASEIHAADAVKSTTDRQTAVAVTVYNNGLGLVKDTRSVEIPAGASELRFMDVASQIMPVTVSARSLTEPGQFRILEQNYEYDLMNHEKVLDKYVGKNIKILSWNEYQDRKDIVEATVLSSEGQIFRIQNEIYLGHPGVKIVPEIPDNLIAQPTLTWQIENGGAPEHTLEVAYLTGGLSWNADYVLTLSSEDKLADQSGWVTITNASGASYNEAKLKVVAGQVNRAAEPVYPMMAKAARYAMADAEQFQQEAFFEYHIYDLQRPTTIKQNQTKQISLLEASGAGVRKEYVVRGDRSYYFQSYGPADRKQPVQVFVSFENSKANRLGMPLPQGTVRMYKKDRDGSAQFIGEDAIKHTPTDETVRLKAGEAFDIVCERKQTDFRQISTRETESEWEITLRNRKDEPVTVSVYESVAQDWKVLSSSHKPVKEDAFTMRFDVPLPKKGEVKVKYRVGAHT